LFGNNRLCSRTVRSVPPYELYVLGPIARDADQDDRRVQVGKRLEPGPFGITELLAGFGDKCNHWFHACLGDCTVRFTRSLYSNVLF